MSEAKKREEERWCREKEEKEKVARAALEAKTREEEKQRKEKEEKEKQQKGEEEKEKEGLLQESLAEKDRTALDHEHTYFAAYAKGETVYKGEFNLQQEWKEQRYTITPYGTNYHVVGDRAFMTHIRVKGKNEKSSSRKFKLLPGQVRMRTCTNTHPHTHAHTHIGRLWRQEGPRSMDRAVRGKVAECASQTTRDTCTRCSISLNTW